MICLWLFVESRHSFGMCEFGEIGITFVAMVASFWGYVTNVVLDSVDGDILARFEVRRDFYQKWDKWMDLWFSLAIGWYVWTNFEGDLIWWILGIVLIWRILGTVLFTFTKKEWILMMFPHLQWKLFFYCACVSFLV